MNEAPHQDRIADLLRMHGCLVFHSRPARTKDGWRTPVSYDGKGYFDLTAISRRNGVVVFIEVKGDGGSLSPDQRTWAQAAANAEVQSEKVHYLSLWPKDWERFVDWCADHL